MTDQSPHQIEREIEAERAELAQTLDKLQDSVSPKALVAKAEERITTDGGAIVRQVADRIAANPLAAAVAAGGLAWLFLGSEKPKRVGHSPRSRLTGRIGQAKGASAYDRDRRRAAQWLMSHDPDPSVSLHKAKAGVSPRVAHMIDRLDEGTGDLPPLAQAKVRKARLRAISARMATERAAAR